MLIFICILFLSAFLKLKRKSIIDSFLVFNLIIIFSTELFSQLKILNFNSVVTFWILILLFLGYYLFKQRVFNYKNFVESKKTIINYFINNRKYQNLLLIIICFFLLVILIQGLVYPPNNWDSLTYHLSRIMYWISNGSVRHFPTHILRHLYQPPLGEYFILHVNLIQGNDFLANSVQWLFLIYCILTFNAILKLLKVKKTNRLITLLLIITIPSVALQASTTKNDIICSFFVLATILYSIRIYKFNQTYDYLFLGLSVGLGMLTKGTFYLFTFPVLLFLFLGVIKKGLSIKIFYYSLFSILIAIIINSGHFIRNYSVNKNILNIDIAEGKMYSNDKMNAKLFISNVLKNSALHLGYPIDSVGDKIVRKIHKDVLKTPINNSETNYLNIQYTGKLEISTHEDYVPNTFHFLLLTFSFFVVGFISINRFNYPIAIITFIVLLQFLIFCGYLKWQPWHTRLHIPIFISGFIIVGLLINKLKYFKILMLLFLPIAVYSFYFNIYYNNLRPFKKDLLYTKDISLEDSRYKKYFSNQLYLYNDYKTIIRIIDKTEIKNIGLSISDWEYPLLKNFYHDKKNIYSIFVNNITGTIPQKIPNIDCLITNQNHEFIIYKEKKYLNITPNNDYIWCYK